MYFGNAKQNRIIIVEFSLMLKYLLLLFVYFMVLPTAHIIEAPLFWWIAYCPNKGVYNLCFAGVLENEQFFKTNTFLF